MSSTPQLESLTSLFSSYSSLQTYLPFSSPTPSSSAALPSGDFPIDLVVDGVTIAELQERLAKKKLENNEKASKKMREQGTTAPDGEAPKNAKKNVLFSLFRTELEEVTRVTGLPKELPGKEGNLGGPPKQATLGEGRSLRRSR